ncbi:BLUF domain-containing protein [Aquisalinus flavus]|uniref:BLUF domain-containing protein n=1 Tax=Aquisalinus flavus TaxID=1526572 RepID=A0A8J2V562_9PROT|nr:BLUF domain-containing protein [Aquisalinus flavus]MBD0425346.1 BLUF domain-containing protein [Aquisalinus flavus]UNE49003.1 BLUF domain-containing protein [Aquisalinus flavus]GGD16833.1 hypothetical protein GCM10011342_26970 [Aquisalinus flavus]
MLYHLAYLSSATHLMSEKAMKDILEKSRHNNKADNITGLLLYNDGSFFQVLEGEKDKVMACYKRIQKDRRHDNCITLLDGEGENRTFMSWDMAFIPFGELNEAQQNHFISLGKLRKSGKMLEMESNKDLRILAQSFLASFGTQFQ